MVPTGGFPTIDTFGSVAELTRLEGKGVHASLHEEIVDFVTLQFTHYRNLIRVGTLIVPIISNESVSRH
jgi:hypothetical protein